MKKNQLMAICYLATCIMGQAFVQAQTAPPDPTLKRYLYSASPGIRDYLQYGGHGIVVFDIDDGYKFVKRIPMGGLNAAGNPENVKGICAHAGTKRLYVSTISSLQSFNLVTGAVIWTKKYNLGFDRMEISPDGKTIYQPSFEKDDWYVLDAATGDEIKRIKIPGIKAHNTNYGQDGKFAYLAGIGSSLLSVAETVNHTVVKTVGPFGGSIRPFTHNGKQTLVYVNVNDLLGFEIGDMQTGRKLHRVEVKGFSQGPVARHACPSHGIALTPDEKEVWIVDGFNHQVHVFDNTVMPPVQIKSIKTRDFPGWISFSIDGSMAYVSTGDIINVKTKVISATLTDEAGRKFRSEKMLEIDFRGSDPVAVGGQFGIGGVTGTVSMHSRFSGFEKALPVKSRYIYGPGSMAWAEGNPEITLWSLNGRRIQPWATGPDSAISSPRSPRSSLSSSQRPAFGFMGVQGDPQSMPALTP